ncbi:MAG TPA: CPBP family intramembrane glutamic endopeptidase, partial [Pyrinomonadaceae bacterium]|nr:CPBP family intramembrane glutamic endopeptidase [Pyrinomonadaceae bacterium]
MEIQDLFINRAGRVRSGWRLAVFVVTFLVVLMVLQGLTFFGLGLLLSRESFDRVLDGWVIQSVIFLFLPAAVAGWACGFVLEELPWRALGWMPHRGWGRDLLLGVLFGAASLGVAALLGVAFGGYRFALNDAAQTTLIVQTLASSAFILLLGAAAEEMLFRGYPLQTLMRSWPLWAALIPSSVFFAAGHLWNPHVAPRFTFVNTFLAGVWLGVAYWRTRSMWFPLGLHWGWNWAMGAILGSPISGITELAPDPILRFSSTGPEWFGGGAYGVEGGTACTLALLVSTAYVWRTRLLSGTEELRQFTDGENPNLSAAPLSNYLASAPADAPADAP